MRWLAVAAAAVAGLLQAAGVGLWGSFPPVSLPAVAVALQVPGNDRRRLLAVALAAGLAWDAAGGAVGAGTLGTLAAALAAEAAAFRWLPPRGATAVGGLAAGAALALRLVLFAAAGFGSADLSAWAVEAAGTGLLAGLLHRVTERYRGL